MSEGEIFVMVASIVAAGYMGARWLVSPMTLTTYSGFSLSRLLLPLAFPACVAGIFVVLKTSASYDVREAPEYLTMYTVLGAAWVLGSAYAMELVGISYRHDALERANPAAAVVVACALISHGLIYAGANIGDGPGWWCVFAAGGLGSGAWFLLWLAIEKSCSASELITVDRDVGAAIRFAGFMLATGLLCGRGSAGDWTALWQTIVEFHVAWPAVGIAAVAVAVERYFSRQPINMSASLRIGVSTLTALGYLAVAIVALSHSPPLPQNPQYDVFQYE
ncbi:MAG: hypothetical protein ACRETN_06325 [Nevskiales bacterium]